jgi:uncharacterized protein YeaC (DUF1315 family)
MANNKPLSLQQTMAHEIKYNRNIAEKATKVTTEETTKKTSEKTSERIS